MKPVSAIYWFISPFSERALGTSCALGSFMISVELFIIIWTAFTMVATGPSSCSSLKRMIKAKILWLQEDCYISNFVSSKKRRKGGRGGSGRPHPPFTNVAAHTLPLTNMAAHTLCFTHNETWKRKNIYVFILMEPSVSF